MKILTILGGWLLASGAVAVGWARFKRATKGRG